MRRLQKLVANGNSTQVTIPRAAMLWLGWLPGEAIIFEVTENKHVVLRQPRADEFLPKRSVSITLDARMPDAR